MFFVLIKIFVRKPKVDEVHGVVIASRSNDHIVWFNVTMNIPLLVEVLYPLNLLITYGSLQVRDRSKGKILQTG